MTKYKVKILKVSSAFDSYGEFDGHMMYPVSTDWETVTKEKREEMLLAVQHANATNRADFKYVLIEYSENIDAEVFKLASDFLAKRKTEMEIAAKKKAEAKAKRDAAALERKKKQLEKLQKELGHLE